MQLRKESTTLDVDAKFFIDVLQLNLADFNNLKEIRVSNFIDERNDLRIYLEPPKKMDNRFITKRVVKLKTIEIVEWDSVGNKILIENRVKDSIFKNVNICSNGDRAYFATAGVSQIYIRKMPKNKLEGAFSIRFVLPRGR